MRAEGSLYFDGPDDRGIAAAALGDSPFSYDVTLALDGDVYRAQPEYPADVITGTSPRCGSTSRHRCRRRAESITSP